MQRKIQMKKRISKNIKLICFDLNKTLIKENTWYDLNLKMGMTPEEDRRLFDLYESGKLSYIEWQKKLTEIYVKNGKASHENISKIILNYSYLNEAKEIIKYLKNKGYELALISGSIDLLVSKVSYELDIKLYGCNNYMIFDNNNYLKDIVVLGDDKEVKVSILKNFCRVLEIKPNQCACVGDGDNDLEIFKYTGQGITFKGSKIEEYASAVIDKLTDLKLIF